MKRNARTVETSIVLLLTYLLLFLVVATIAVIDHWFNEVKEAMDNNSIYNDYYNNDDM